jgi:hypothetical protein
VGAGIGFALILMGSFLATARTPAAARTPRTAECDAMAETSGVP